MKVNVKKVSPNAVIPTYAKVGDAALDLTAVDVFFDPPTKCFIYDTGLAFEIPEGYVGLVYQRSSIFKTGLSLSNAVGVIDSGYRNSVKVVFRVVDESAPIYKTGDRVAQIIIVPYPVVELEEVDQLTTTERGLGGFGSTGK